MNTKSKNNVNTMENFINELVEKLMMNKDKENMIFLLYELN